MTCNACGGTGVCGPCDGYGYLEEGPDCEWCDGDGGCPECGGSGENTAQDEITEMEVSE